MEKAESGLHQAAQTFRCGEPGHRDLALESRADHAGFHRLLTAAIKAGCGVATATGECV